MEYKMPERILIVLGGLNRGGAETVVMNYYRHINKNRIQFDFVVHSSYIGAYEKEVQSMGGRIWHIPKFKIYNFFSYRNVWKKLLREHPEFRIIHAHMASTACLFISIAHERKMKVIVHAHSSRNTGNLIKRCLERISFYPLRYMADYFFACSNEAGTFKFGKSILSNPRYKIWYNALDFSEFEYSIEKRQKIRKLLGLSDDKFIIGHSGRLSYPKNHDFLLKTFRQYLLTHKNAVLLLLGDGPLRTDLESQVKRLKIQDSVIFTGSVNNVSDYLSAMDIFLFPSFYEGLGLAAIEAQVSGLYVIASSMVPQAAKISEHIEFNRLDLGEIFWCQQIEKAPRINRKCYHLKNPNYDIYNAVQRAEKFYLSLR